MARIKNISQRVKMVADRYLQPGEARNITAKQAAMYQHDPNFEITGETVGLDTPVSTPATRPAEGTLLKVQIVDDEPVQAELEVASETGQGLPAPTLPAKVRKPRGKKK